MHLAGPPRNPPFRTDSVEPQGLQDQAAGELGAQGGNVPGRSWGGFRGLGGGPRLFRRPRVKAMEKVELRPLDQIAESVLRWEESWFLRAPSATHLNSSRALQRLCFQVAPHGPPRGVFAPVSLAVLGAPAVLKTPAQTAFSLANHIHKRFLCEEICWKQRRISPLPLPLGSPCRKLPLQTRTQMDQ